VKAVVSYLDASKLNSSLSQCFCGPKKPRGLNHGTYYSWPRYLSDVASDDRKANTTPYKKIYCSRPGETHQFKVRIEIRAIDSRIYP
jgi:hypothetical protein